MTSLHLCGPEDADRLLPLVAAFHAEYGLALTDAERETAILPLLSGSPLGAVWLAGPVRAPLGYVVVTFGWSVKLGGMEAHIDELYIRPKVRKRGIGSSVLYEIGRALAGVEIRALHLTLDRADSRAEAFYARAGFALQDRVGQMTLRL